MSVYVPTDEADFDPQRLIQKYIRCNKPFDIYMKIKERVLAQDDAIRQASLLVYAYLKTLADGNYMDYKYHFMIEAESGCGKSTFANALKAAVPIPVIICDASQITGAGWKGCDASDILDSSELEQWGCGIIVLDELDKAIMPLGTDVAHHRLVQESFLKMLDGGTVHSKDGKAYDCCRYLFIGMGAFTPMREKKKPEVRPIGFGAVQKATENAITDSITRDSITAVCGSEQFMGRMVAVLHFQRLGMGHYKIMLQNAVDEVCRMYGNWQLPRDKEIQILHEAIQSPYGARNIRNRVWECFMAADSSMILYMKREEALDRKLRQGYILEGEDADMVYKELFDAVGQTLSA